MKATFTGGRIMEETKATRSAHRRYIREFFGAMAAYVVVLMAVVPFVSERVDSPWRVPVGLLPLLPIALMVWVLIRHYGRVDEMYRRAIVESMAFAFIVSAPVVITLGFLESAGIPISIWWAWVVMGAAWAVSALVLQLRYR